MRSSRTLAALACVALSFVIVAACGGGDDEETGGGGETAATTQEDLSGLSGNIRIDGSSTVQPLAEAASELFQEEAPNVRITVGGAGTGDGFERFCRGEIDISDASRAIEKQELDACRKANVEPVEVQVGIDGLSVIAHQDLAIPDDCITTGQLKRLLAPRSDISNYQQLGGGFPDQQATFFTPGTESGTYDYFTEEVLETDAEQRTKNVQTSADDNQIVTGISGTEGALGYVGYAFAQENASRVKILAVNGGEGCVKPSIDTIADGRYTPLSRPLFMYPNTKTVARPEVKGYIGFVLDKNREVNESSGYISLTDELLTESREALEAGKANVEPPPA